MRYSTKFGVGSVIRGGMQGSEDILWGVLNDVDSVVRDEDHVVEAVALRLSRLPVPRIAGFHLALVGLADRALTWDLWQAADLVHRSECSEDVFLDFRLWLIGQGESFFESVMNDPDSLARHPAIQRLSTKDIGQRGDADFPHMGSLISASEIAFDMIVQKLGPAYGVNLTCPDELNARPKEVPDDIIPEGFGSAALLQSEYPHLFELFG